MYKRMFLLSLTLFLTCCITIACSKDDNNDGNNNADTPPETEVNDNDNQDNNNNTNNDSNTEDNQNNENDINENENNNDNANSANESATDAEETLPSPIDINEEIIHPNGVILTLEKITFKEDHITVDFNAINESGFAVYLASEGKAVGENLGGVTLGDDQGHMYRYVADDNYRSIKIEKQEKVSGSISFLGKIRDNATSITVIFNPQDYASEKDGYTNSPKFVFDDIKIDW